QHVSRTRPAVAEGVGVSLGAGVCDGTGVSVGAAVGSANGVRVSVGVRLGAAVTMGRNVGEVGGGVRLGAGVDEGSASGVALASGAPVGAVVGADAPGRVAHTTGVGSVSGGAGSSPSVQPAIPSAITSTSRSRFDACIRFSVCSESHAGIVAWTPDAAEKRRQSDSSLLFTPPHTSSRVVVKWDGANDFLARRRYDETDGDRCRRHTRAAGGR